MQSLEAFIPLDRRRAMASGETLPDRAEGAVLFADISGFTPLTEALVETLGPRRGADELTQQLNAVYGVLIAQIHEYGGSVIGFSGDAILCWFDVDPLLLSPTGSTGHVGERAIACALKMQQVMGQFDRVSISAGSTINLAIKVAITAGPVRRFLVGDPEIQYLDVLAGATVDRIGTAEKQVNKGEVIVGSEVVAAIGHRLEIGEWRHEIETGQRFAVVTKLLSPPRRTPWPALPPLKEKRAHAWLLPPVYERLRTGRGRFLAEFRGVVALFMKFGGLDDQDQDAGVQLNNYIRWVQSILADHGGYLIQLTTGDKGKYLYAAFGAPLVHDPDPSQAVAAAHMLQSPPPALNFITSVQIGISYGPMWTGAYGSQTRHTYGVMGDEVNVAARLMQRAKPGQILVSQRIADAAVKHYHCQYLGPVTVKGKLDLVPVYMILDRHPASWQSHVPLFSNPIVGREEELAQMEQWLEPVLAGQGQIFRIEGVTGIGKSRLAAEFAERARRRGLRVVWGTCQSTTQDVPYFSWRQVFRVLFALTDDPQVGEDQETLITRQIAQVEALVEQTNPGWRYLLPLLGDLLDLPIPIPGDATASPFEPDVRQGTLIALVMEIIQTWSRDQPLLLLIEDVHWMDEASQGLTRALGHIIANVPVLLALVHRPTRSASGQEPILSDLSQLSYHHQLTLAELSSSATATLVTNRLRGEPSSLVLSLIQARAENNPFFTEELVDALREAGRIYRQDDGKWSLTMDLFNTLHEANCLVQEPPDGRWGLAPKASLAAVDLGVPDSIEDLVKLRLDHLSEAHKLTLKVASAIGRTFELDLLIEAHPDQLAQAPLLAQLEELETQALIRSEALPQRQAYTFNHNIIQEVVYQTLPESQQRELQLAVGQALERLLPEAIERLAHHFTQASEGKKALDYLLRAGDRARGLYAYQEAQRYYERASQFLPTLGDADSAVALRRYRERMWGLQRELGIHRSTATEQTDHTGTDRHIMPPVLQPASASQKKILKDRYVLQEKIGRGATGEVWLAVDRRVNRPVTIKYLGVNEPHFKELFQAEARTLRNLDHPNIAPIYDGGFDEAGGYFLVTSPMRGKQLAQIIQEQAPLDPDYAIATAADILRAIQHAHQHGVRGQPDRGHRPARIWPSLVQPNQRAIRHGNLKPADILIVDGNVIVMDIGLFDLVAQLRPDSAYPGDRSVYLPPETIRDQSKNDVKTDIYSLGVILFEMLTGRLPFAEEENLTPDFRLRSPLSLTAFVPTAPARLEQVLDKVLSPHPDDRYPSAAILLDELLSIRTQQEPWDQEEAPTELAPPAKRTLVTSPSGFLLTALAITSLRPSHILALFGGALLMIGLIVLVLVALTIIPNPLSPSAATYEGMVRIDGGSYPVGLATPDGEHAAIRQMGLSEFWIDQYEVTNAQYAEFISKTYWPAPGTWSEGRYEPGQEVHPVKGVPWQMAKAYCEWANKRLPTEAEWEVAARGPAGWRYPWGNDQHAVKLPQNGTHAVGSKPDNKSPFGAYDMAGNVWEWVGQTYAPVANGHRVLRGGANGSLKDMAYRLQIDPASPAVVDIGGIRCATD